MINDQIQRDYLTSALCERELSTEVAGDFVLPDYQCEIRRVLYVDGTVLPPTKYVGATEVEFSGTVDFSVTYVGGDGELYCIPLSETYEFSVPIDREVDADALSVLCSIRIDGVNTRVSAPRKLNIRCRLRPYVRVMCERSTASEILGGSAETVFRRMVHAERLECESSLSEIVPVECVLLPLADDVRIVSADAFATVTSCAYVQDAVRTQGKLCVKLVCVSDSGEFSTRIKEVPFECQNDMALRDANLRAKAIVCDMAVNVGDEGVECSGGIVSEVVACANVDQEYTADAYSAEYECRCITAPMSVRSLAMCAMGNATLSERISLSETTIPADAQIIDTHSRANMQSCEWQGGKYVFSGNADLAVIWRSAGDFGASELHIPLRYEHSCPEGAEAACFDCGAALDGLRCRIEGDNLCVDAELMVSADCMVEQAIELVESLELLEKHPAQSAAMLTVCYPDPEDTLWSVAKRYRVSPAAVVGEVGSDRFVFIE